MIRNDQNDQLKRYLRCGQAIIQKDFIRESVSTDRSNSQNDGLHVCLLKSNLGHVTVVMDIE